MSRKTPSPFKFRGKWRGQVTLKNGTRPHADYEKFGDARDWITDQLANANTEHRPELGGPKQANLAQALAHYAGLNTITKGGYAAEIDRINRYLEGTGLKLLKIVTVGDKRQLTEKPVKALPKAFGAHRDQRLSKRDETCKLISALAKRSCSSLCAADIRRLMVAMETEGLSPSTIQKEIALFKHMFNVAAKEWNWKGFENPCVGIKLGTSNQRFVFMTQDQQVAMRGALSECDNPYFWSLVEICLQTTLRRGSLLAMTRQNVDLDGRIAMLPTKTGPAPVPLSKKAVQLLRDMPVHPSGKYFPMTGNAVELAWEGVRDKIGMPELQFKDLRHIGATEYARAGANSHQLQKILAHATSRMAEIYVNLVNTDALNFMDSIAPSQTVYQIPEPAKGTGDEIMKRNRSKRIADAVVEAVKSGIPVAPSSDAPADAPAHLAPNGDQHRAVPGDSPSVQPQVASVDCAEPMRHVSVESNAVQPSFSDSGQRVAAVPAVEASVQGLVSDTDPSMAATGTDGVQGGGISRPSKVVFVNFNRRR